MFSLTYLLFTNVSRTTHLVRHCHSHSSCFSTSPLDHHILQKRKKKTNGTILIHFWLALKKRIFRQKVSICLTTYTVNGMGWHELRLLCVCADDDDIHFDCDSPWNIVVNIPKQILDNSAHRNNGSHCENFLLDSFSFNSYAFDKPYATINAIAPNPKLFGLIGKSPNLYHFDRLLKKKNKRIKKNYFKHG